MNTDMEAKKDKADKKAEKSNIYERFSVKSAELIGNEWAFILSCSLTIIWLVLGPFYNYSNTWQQIIGIFTAIITFLIVFLIQNTQFRDTKQIQLKLDELLRCHKLAHNSTLDLDKLSNEGLKELEKKYKELSNSNENQPEVKK